jgi:hypothetical protein
MTRRDIWQEVERLLGTDAEYGDSAAIERRVLGRLRVGLTMLADLRPQTRRCAASSDADLRVMSRDPVLRNAFESDLQALTAQSDAGPLLPGLLPADSGYAVSRAAGEAGGYAWRSTGFAWV